MQLAGRDYTAREPLAPDECDRLMNGRQSHDGSADEAVALRADADDAAEQASPTKVQDFLCGVAMSVYQNAGGPSTNWEAFENQRCMFFNNIHNGDRCREGNGFWDLYEADLERAKQLNCKFFRLSIEWSRIQPRPGEVDPAAIERYHQIFDVLDRLGMKTTATLYHFVHPLWFDEMGHFERKENIQYFVEFVKVAFKHFGRRTKLWATFNECNVQIFCQYIYGSFPPAKHLRFGVAGQYMLHLYQAHIAAYHAIKASPGGDAVQVGIVHNYMKFEAKYPISISASWVCPIVEQINKVWGNSLTVEFFTSGAFVWPKFFTAGWTWQHPGGRPPCDFIGLNYYGRGMIDWTLQPTCRKGDLQTDMPFAAYAPGFYTAIADMSDIGLPIYITETGICDHTTLKRPEFFHSYLDEIVKAVEDGYDVRGLTMWTLIDNYEWAEGWCKKFGLYGFDITDPERKRTLHETSKVLAKIYETFPDRIRAARRHWAMRKLTNSAPEHIPPPDESAREDLKHGHPILALRTHQIGVL